MCFSGSPDSDALHAFSHSLVRLFVVLPVPCSLLLSQINSFSLTLLHKHMHIHIASSASAEGIPGTEADRRKTASLWDFEVLSHTISPNAYWSASKTRLFQNLTQYPVKTPLNARNKLYCVCH